MLRHTNPDVNDTFINEGNFVISRTPNVFSAMNNDRCYDQLNKRLKGDGGNIGIAEDEDRLRKWMVCGPEVARILMEFEKNSVLKQTRKI